jgi:hypothetical protein
MATWAELRSEYGLCKTERRMYTSRRARTNYGVTWQNYSLSRFETALAATERPTLLRTQTSVFETFPTYYPCLVRNQNQNQNTMRNVPYKTYTDYPGTLFIILHQLPGTIGCSITFLQVRYKSVQITQR